MLNFYFNGSPNPTKIALFLEEAELPYQGVPVDTRQGHQFAPAFVAGDDGWATLPHLKRLTDEISARPSAARAIALKDNFAVKLAKDEEARGHMFKHLVGAA